MNGPTLSIPKRMLFLRFVLTLVMVTSIFLSLKLWGGDREFPKTNLLPMRLMKAGPDLLLPLLAVLFFLGSLVFHFQRLLLLIGYLICVLLLVTDVERLQLWSFMYMSLFMVFLLYNGRVDDPNRYTSYFIILQMIISSYYFFTGLWQLNDHFLNGPYTELVEPMRKYLSERQHYLLLRCGMFSPYVFMFTGVALMISPIRYLAITTAILLHVAVLCLRFPSPQHPNSGVYLMNVFLMIAVVVLFAGKTKQRYYNPIFLFQNVLFYAVMLFHVALPFTHLSDNWPEILSWNFRSGNNTTGEFRLSVNAYTQLPLYEKHYCVKQGDHYLLDHRRWCEEELKSDLLPTSLVHYRIQDHLIEALPYVRVKEIELNLRPPTPLLLKR
jgi:hypothetical protein